MQKGRRARTFQNDFKIGKRIDSMNVNETKLLACHALLWRRPLQILRTFGRTPQRTSGYRHTSPKNRLCDFSRKDEIDYIRKLMIMKALKDLVAAMFECELLKHAEGGILARPGGEGGPTIDSQVDEDSCQFVLFRHFLQ